MIILRPSAGRALFQRVGGKRPGRVLLSFDLLLPYVDANLRRGPTILDTSLGLLICKRH